MRPRSANVTPPEAAIVVSTVSRKIAIRSSMMRIPKTSSVTRPFTCCSSNALTMIVVLEIPMMAPAKMLSMRVKPSVCPTRYPTDTITLHSNRATAPAF